MANQSSSFKKGDGIDTVREVDGAPSIPRVTVLEVSDGTLSNPAPGVARIQTGGGGGSGPYQLLSEKGQPNGYASLDGSGRIPNSELPLPLSDYTGRFESASQPSTGDIGDGQWGWWRNTTTGQIFIVRNRGGQMYAVEVNPLT